MTTIELKNILIQKIASIDDESLLAGIKSLIESWSESAIYHTTPEQRQRIMEGKEQLAEGKYFTNDQVEKEIDKWLKEK